MASFSTSIVLANEPRTAAPAQTEMEQHEVDLGSKGGGEIRAQLRVTSLSAGSSDQQWVIRPQHAHVQSASAWEDIPGLAFVVKGDGAAATVPGLEPTYTLSMIYKPIRKFWRWTVETPTGTTTKASFSLEQAILSSAGGACEKIYAPLSTSTSSITVGTGATTIFGPYPVMSMCDISFVIRNTGGAQAFNTGKVLVANTLSTPTTAEWSEYDIATFSTLAANGEDDFRIQNNSFRWVGITASVASSTTTAVVDFSGSC